MYLCLLIKGLNECGNNGDACEGCMCYTLFVLQREKNTRFKKYTVRKTKKRFGHRFKKCLKENS